MNLWEIALAALLGWGGGVLAIFFLHRRTERKERERYQKPRQPKEYNDDDATTLASDAADADAQYSAALRRAKRRRAELRARLESELWPDSGESGGDGNAGD